MGLVGVLGLGVNELGADEELVGLDLTRRVEELVSVAVVGRRLVADAAGKGVEGKGKGGVVWDDNPHVVGSGLALLILAGC